MRLYQVDAFTKKPFAGNPAGVCITKEPLEEKLMQGIAKEMNLSETAFLVKREDGFDLRWLTPNSEVSLCGHATLASAHVLFSRRILEPEETAVFHTKSGDLYASKEDGKITLDFPVKLEEAFNPPELLREALGCTYVYAGKNQMDVLLELDSEETVRTLSPSISLLSGMSGVRGVIVTAKGKDYDFVSRFFAPAVGIAEDPVTGSAHCCLVPYWAKKLGKEELHAYQASERGGELFCKLCGDRVRLSGNAVTVMEIDLIL